MQLFTRQVIDLLTPPLAEHLSPTEIAQLIEVPKIAAQGDLAFPTFRLAKLLRKAPPLIAQDIAQQIETEAFDIKTDGAYINFFVKREVLAETVVGTILDQADGYGCSDEGRGQRVLVEYNSANISKDMHHGYIRGLMIGASIYKIAQCLGYETVTINHLGDYGINFGMIIVAFKRWGDREDVERRGVSALNELYVRFRQEAEDDPTLMKEAREWFKHLEDGTSEEAHELWTWFKEVSLRDYDVVWRKLGSHFDSFAGEAFYSDMMPAVRQELLDKELIFTEDGAELIDLSSENLPNIIVTTSSGNSLYITRDIAAAKYRKDTYDFARNIYVVGSEQRLHFQQLKAILKKMGYDWYDQIVHVDHGLIMLADGKMSSRTGEVVLLNDVLETAIERTRQLIEQKNPELVDKDEVARQVGLGAIAFKELYTSRIKDYVFDWDDALSFEGETGPYLQYTNVRCHSLLMRGGETEGEIDYALLDDDFSNELIRELAQFPETIHFAFERYEPALISRYLIGVAKLFNKFYQQVTILSNVPAERTARLALVRAVSQTLENGMKLINMEAPKRM
ncbi:MAG TPA: arginine--tRNA ligase [Tissierellia bacterium]|nr:arginine--tRNA ligase [Tissierellia bacterium]